EKIAHRVSEPGRPQQQQRVVGGKFGRAQFQHQHRDQDRKDSVGKTGQPFRRRRAQNAMMGRRKRCQHLAHGRKKSTTAGLFNRMRIVRTKHLSKENTGFLPRWAKPMTGEDVSERLRERDRWELKKADRWGFKKPEIPDCAWRPDAGSPP